jgi:hypothetical protein
LQQPAFKFADGRPYMDAIKQITERAAKVFYFDQHGVAHYEEYQDLIKRSLLNGIDLPSLFDFTSNPNLYTGQLMFNKVDYSYNVGDVYNHIKIFSNTPNMELLCMDDLDWRSYDNPTFEGFIGYLKTFYQQEGAFGSEEAARRAIDTYRIFWRPPINFSFETYGLPIRALDMVKVDGQTVRVNEVTHEIDPSKNVWWMNLRCERWQPVN